MNNENGDKSNSDSSKADLVENAETGAVDANADEVLKPEAERGGLDEKPEPESEEAAASKQDETPGQAADTPTKASADSAPEQVSEKEKQIAAFIVDAEEEPPSVEENAQNAVEAEVVETTDDVTDRLSAPGGEDEPQDASPATSEEMHVEATPDDDAESKGGAADATETPPKEVEETASTSSPAADEIPEELGSIEDLPGGRSSYPARELRVAIPEPLEVASDQSSAVVPAPAPKGRFGTFAALVIGLILGGGATFLAPQLLSDTGKLGNEPDIAQPANDQAVGESQVAATDGAASDPCSANVLAAAKHTRNDGARTLQITIAGLFNDPEGELSSQIETALTTSADEQSAAFPAVTRVSCVPLAIPSSRMQLAANAEAVARLIAQQTDADVVAWGERLDSGGLALHLSHTMGIDRAEFVTENLHLEDPQSTIAIDLLRARVLYGIENLVGIPAAQKLGLAEQALAALTNHAVSADLSSSTQSRIHQSRARLLFADGTLNRDNERLGEATDWFSKALENVDRKDDPNHWSSLQFDLGNALVAQGTLLVRSQIIGDGIEAFSAALSEQTAGRDPDRWALIQSARGNALTTVGQLESGSANLLSAANALTESLDVRNQVETPLQWAATQHNLGSIYQTIAQRTQEANWLTESVKHYRLALEVRTAADQPIAFAATQSDLGSSLIQQGLINDDEASFAAAAAAYDLALAALPEGETELRGSVQHSLGNALAALAEFREGVEELQRAALAYSASAEVFPRESDPLRWAINENNMANALRVWGERAQDTEVLNASIAAYEAALSVMSEAAPGYVNGIIENLSKAQQLFAELGG